MAPLPHEMHDANLTNKGWNKNVIAILALKVGVSIS